MRRPIYCLEEKGERREDNERKKEEADEEEDIFEIHYPHPLFVNQDLVAD